MPVTGKLLKDQWDAVALASAVLLVLSFVLGGASQNHALRLALVELAALPVLVLAAGRIVQTGLWREHRLALGLTAALVAIPLIQLIPLPPAIWTGLPGRDQMVLALELAGLEPGWTPLSLTPDRTWRSALALTPPVAFFLAVLSMSHIQRERMVHLLIAAAVVGILLGAAQLVSGGDRLYLWHWTDAGSVNGFFANRNHLASSLLITLPFAITMGASTLRRRDRGTSALWLGALFAGLVVVALAAIRSRAGIALFAPVMVASLLAAWIAAGRGRPGPGLLLLVGSVGAALTIVAVLALPPILARFDIQSAPEGRFDRWPLVAEAAQTYLPLGAGMGSFDAVYRSVEPLEQLDSTFFNQAHNEYLETWLEAGWLGIGLVIAFSIWWFRRSWSAWRAPPSREGDLQRAASIAIGVALLHSIGDYPLRTVTLAVVFALCCGILEFSGRPPQPRSRAEAKTRSRNHSSRTVQPMDGR
ncbi:MAG: O-antigen ligase family protein [Brevundimonas sp.]|uniref:O-antigen ligase family protein n=1 Tax=Brevundimonas sp. TaxID=1871086 RepID=UPI0026090F63|nr:O-antigen ligase family protein [Brevundimonas sp.]MDI6623111.1 O-antigen ligase family protein [Brevundimonas sp.]MDQ7813542.1 O-antigen ligase family protein [Brevundimonas sp.]